MEIPTIEQVLASIDAFLERHSMAKTRFGREATGEADLVDTLRKGRRPSLETLKRITDFMKAEDSKLAAASSGKTDNISRDAGAVL